MESNATLILTLFALAAYLLAGATTSMLDERRAARQARSQQPAPTPGAGD